MILEQIKDNLGLIASIITSSGVIASAFLWVGKKILDKTLKPFSDKIDKLEKARIEQHKDTVDRINKAQISADKNFLVRFLADIEQENKVDETEKERFYEVYKDYKDLGGNSYISHKVEKLQKEGKL